MLTFSLDLTEQQGRLVRGTRTSERYTEKVVCAIDYDNESIRCTDEDGMLDGKLVNTNEITYHYHPVSPEESEVYCQWRTLPLESGQAALAKFCTKMAGAT